MAKLNKGQYYSNLIPNIIPMKHAFWVLVVLLVENNVTKATHDGPQYEIVNLYEQVPPCYDE